MSGIEKRPSLTRAHSFLFTIFDPGLTPAIRMCFSIQIQRGAVATFKLQNQVMYELEPVLYIQMYLPLSKVRRVYTSFELHFQCNGKAK